MIRPLVNDTGKQQTSSLFFNGTGEGNPYGRRLSLEGAAKSIGQKNLSHEESRDYT